MLLTFKEQILTLMKSSLLFFILWFVLSVSWEVFFLSHDQKGMFWSTNLIVSAFTIGSMICLNWIFTQGVRLGVFFPHPPTKYRTTYWKGSPLATWALWCLGQTSLGHGLVSNSLLLSLICLSVLMTLSHFVPHYSFIGSL